MIIVNVWGIVPVNSRVVDIDRHRVGGPTGKVSGTSFCYFKLVRIMFAACESW